MKNRPRTPADRQRIRELSEDPKVTVKSICEAVGVTRRTVLTHCTKAFKVRNIRTQMNTRF
jgi:transposase-like protein